MTAAQDTGSRCSTPRTSACTTRSTLRDWNRNLVEHWDECVAEVGEGTARVWGIYIAGSRLGFERTRSSCTRCWRPATTTTAAPDFPMRPDW